jgi:hypothetical protein
MLGPARRGDTIAEKMRQKHGLAARACASD